MILYLVVSVAVAITFVVYLSINMYPLTFKQLLLVDGYSETANTRSYIERKLPVNIVCRGLIYLQHFLLL